MSIMPPSPFLFLVLLALFIHFTIATSPENLRPRQLSSVGSGTPDVTSTSSPTTVTSPTPSISVISSNNPNPSDTITTSSSAVQDTMTGSPPLISPTVQPPTTSTPRDQSTTKPAMSTTFVSVQSSLS